MILFKRRHKAYHREYHYYFYRNKLHAQNDDLLQRRLKTMRSAT